MTLEINVHGHRQAITVAEQHEILEMDVDSLEEYVKLLQSILVEVRENLGIWLKTYRKGLDPEISVLGAIELTLHYTIALEHLLHKLDEIHSQAAAIAVDGGSAHGGGGDVTELLKASNRWKTWQHEKIRLVSQ